jgi:outer membrane protein assembly factor BamB
VTDEEIIDLVDRTPLEDLTSEQCAAILAATKESPAIRRACLERIGLEERLAATLGRPQVSVDELLAGQRRAAALRGRAPWLTFAILGLVLAAIAAVVSFRRRPPVDASVALAPADVEQAATETPAGEEAVADAEPRASEPPAEARPEANPVAAKPADVKPAAAEAPWAKAIAADAPEPQTSDLFKLLPYRLPHPGELELWFRPLSGTPSKCGAVRVGPNLDMMTMEGAFRLVPPLRAGTALRLIVTAGNYRIVAWSGNRGAALEVAGPREGGGWCGSVLTRPAVGTPADGRWLASTSDGRGPRANVGLLGPVELRYADGCLILSRGEVRLVEVPLPAEPDEVLFEGRVGIAGMELVRAVDPPRLPPPPAPTAVWKPADLAWEGSGAAALEKQPSGAVRLVQPEAAPTGPLVATWNLPPPGLGPREIVLKIDECASGCGIHLAGPGGVPALICGMVDPTGGPADTRRNGFVVWQPGRPAPALDGKNPAVRFAPLPLWLRLQIVNGSLLMTRSGDGQHWARAWDYPAWTGLGGIASVGLTVGGRAGGGITLSRVGVAELPGLARIMPRDMLEAADSFTLDQQAAKQFDSWLEAAKAARPKGRDEARWLAAAAIRSLATDRTFFSQQLALLAWRHTESLELPFDERLAVTDDVSRLSLALDPRDASVYNALYGVIARDCAARGDAAGCRAAWLRMQQAPSNMGQAAYDLLVDVRGIRSAILRDLMTTAPAAEVRSEFERQRFYANDSGPVAVAARQVESGGSILTDSANRLSNTVQEFLTMLDTESWEDAARVVARHVADTGGDDGNGLVPDPHDARRLATMLLLVDDALRERPAFREFMLGNPAERGRLRVLQLKAAGNARGMLAATLEFHGTPAAADAREWLALRALAAGECATAREHVRMGLAWATAETRDRLHAVRALADSLSGQAAAQPPATGLPGIPAGELAAIVSAAAPSAAIAVRPADLVATKRLDLGPPTAAIPVIDFPSSIGGDVYGPDGDSPLEPFPPSPPFFSHRLDWAAEVCALVPAADRLLASNRVEVVSLDPSSGAVQWRSAAGPKPGTLGSCGLFPMPPVCDDRHAYLRWLGQGPTPSLVALRLADGSVAWESPATGPTAPISDPVLVGTTLRYCAVRKGAVDQLVLVAVDPASGRQLFERPLCSLLPDWWVPRGGGTFLPGDCQMTAAGGTLCIATAGAVICCEPDGRLRWIRRQPWIGPAGDSWWWYQSPAPPLVLGESVVVMQPGVQTITAIDAATGRLQWQTPLPRSRRLVGLAGTGTAARLVVETGEGIVTCDPRDGTLRRILSAREKPGPGPLGLAPTRLLGATVATGDGMAIAAVQQQRPGTDKEPIFDVALLWIDVASGAVRHTAPLPDLAGPQPWVGPMAAAAGRLWLLVAPAAPKNQPSDVRRGLWELVPAPAH